MSPRTLFVRILRYRVVLLLLCVALLLGTGLFFTVHKPTQAQASSPCPPKTFSLYTSPISSAQSTLQATAAVSATDIWAVGNYVSGSNTYTTTLIEQWNGSSWSVIPSPNNGASTNSLAAVSAVSASDVWAGGTYFDVPSSSHLPLFEHWNGAAWSIVPGPTFPSGTEASVNGLAAIATNDVWAVGDINGGAQFAWTAHWDGTAWTTISNAAPIHDNTDMLGIKAFASNNVWAVGSDLSGTTGLAPLVEHWNGSSWANVSMSSAHGALFNTIGGSAPNDIWALGDIASSTNPPFMIFADHWNGTTWTVVPTAPLNVANSEFLGMSVLSSTNVFAVGVYNINSNFTPGFGLIEQWNGSTWSLVPNTVPIPAFEYRLDGITAVSTNEAWAVGAGYIPESGPTHEIVEHYPGSFGASFACHP